MLKNELTMFGCTKDELNEYIEDARDPMMGGLPMLAMSILSDAQECIAIGNDELARQFINRAKYVIKNTTP